MSWWPAALPFPLFQQLLGLMSHVDGIPCDFMVQISSLPFPLHPASGSAMVWVLAQCFLIPAGRQKFTETHYLIFLVAKLIESLIVKFHISCFLWKKNFIFFLCIINFIYREKKEVSLRLDLTIPMQRVHYYHSHVVMQDSNPQKFILNSGQSLQRNWIYQAK